MHGWNSKGNLILGTHLLTWALLKELQEWNTEAEIYQH